jgi:hypothetical protein
MGIAGVYRRVAVKIYAEVCDNWTRGMIGMIRKRKMKERQAWVSIERRVNVLLVILLVCNPFL